MYIYLFVFWSYWIAIGLPGLFPSKDMEPVIMTVTGPVSDEEISLALSHEHILVDFIGAEFTGYHRWDRAEVVRVVAPYLEELTKLGCNTLFDCTPAYIGRDPILLRTLSQKCGMHLVTNTGYYGARDNQFIPAFAYTESAAQLAQRWILEWEEGIEDTDIKPGFIKIGIDEGPLSEMHKKLVRAAALAHLSTGLTIAGHTGSAVGAFEEFDILKESGVAPEAFIWVHAQNEKDLRKHVEAANRGFWVSFDGVGPDNIEQYTALLKNMRGHQLLGRTLISHDAGWYSPGAENGGDFRGFNTIFNLLLPALKGEGFTKGDIELLLRKNPINAYRISVRAMP